MGIFLGNSHHGVKDICLYLGWKQGESINCYLNDLKKYGFIESYISKPPGKKATDKNIRFRVSFRQVCLDI